MVRSFVVHKYVKYAVVYFSHNINSWNWFSHIFFFWPRENDIENVLDHTFSVEHNSFGKVQEYELKPGGKDVSVTEENKREYVK